MLLLSVAIEPQRHQMWWETEGGDSFVYTSSAYFPLKTTSVFAMF
jgi:hypothetical protein